MANQELSPEQRRDLAEDFAAELTSPENVRRRMKAEERLRRGLPRGRSREVLMTRIGPGPSADVAMTRIGPPKREDHLFDKRGEDSLDSFPPLRFIHELPLNEDPQSLDEI